MSRASGTQTGHGRAELRGRDRESTALLQGDANGFRMRSYSATGSRIGGSLKRCSSRTRAAASLQHRLRSRGSAICSSRKSATIAPGSTRWYRCTTATRSRLCQDPPGNTGRVKRSRGPRYRNRTAAVRAIEPGDLAEETAVARSQAPSRGRRDEVVRPCSVSTIEARMRQRPCERVCPNGASPPEGASGRD